MNPVIFYGCQLVLGLLACFFGFALQGYATIALVCVGLAGVLWSYRLGFWLKKKHHKWGKAVIRVLTILLCMGFLVFAVTEFFIIRASFGNPGQDAAYLLVLGAKVNPNGPSVSLRNRIHAAYDYLLEHPNTISILSGGQGTNEHISEAQCMFEELTAMGIPANRLWLEDQSTSTWENLTFTLQLLQENTGKTPDSIAIVTSEYHLYRAGLFASRLGLESVGVPAKTTLPVLKINYFIREAVAVWYHTLCNHH